MSKKSLKNLSVLTLLTLLNFSATAQESEITGIVTSEGDPIPGVNVLLEGTTIGTVTDANGKYQISAASNVKVLVFSFIGMETQKVEVAGRSIIDVSMDFDILSLSEVVVVGYGTQKRSDLTAAISSVSETDIAEIPLASVGQVLQGRAAGVSVTNSGGPGQPALVRIRGLSTFGNGDPLYVVDGVFTSSINNINQSSIKSIDILKDAAASAVYGSRASNGVIIITTDKGTAGKVKFKLNVSTGVQSSNKRYDVLNTEQYIQYITEINEQNNSGIDGTEVGVIQDRIDAGLPAFDGNGVNTNWQDALFQNGKISSIDFSASGGSEKGTYSFGASSFNQEGVYIDTNFDRYAFNANSSANITDKLTVGETLSVGFSETIAPQISDGRQPLFNVLASAPYTPIFDGAGGFAGQTNQDANNSRNQIRVQNTDDNISKSTTLIGSIYGQYEIIDGLTIKTQLGLDAYYNQFNTHLRSYEESGTDGQDGQFKKIASDATKRRTNQISTIITNSLSYNKAFANVHNVGVTAVYEKQETTIEQVGASSTNALSNVSSELVSANPGVASASLDEILISYLGRVNYNYDGKYFFSGSIRRDKSSRFFEPNAAGIFPAASLGWLVSKESFLSGNPIISRLKVRASIGVTGNNSIPRNRFNPLLSQNFNYTLDDAISTGVAPGGFANRDLTWEESTKMNIGFDAGFLNDKFTASFEYFTNESTDLLIGRLAPPTTGVPGILLGTGAANGGPIAENAAAVDVKGIEITLGYNDTQGDFQWSAWGNVSTAVSTVVSTGPDPANVIKNANSAAFATQLSNLAVGLPFYHFNGFIFEGVYSTEQDIIDHLGADNVVGSGSTQTYQVNAGDARYADISGPDGVPDGDIDAFDRTVIGDPNPDFTYAISLRASYKGIDASALISGVQGVDIFNANKFSLESQELVLNRGTEVLRRWQNPGDITDVPRYRFGGQNSNNAQSTRWIEDGSYARLKNITIGYTLPESALNKAFKGTKIKVRLFVSARNLITVTKYNGQDPEVAPFYGATNGAIQGLGSAVQGIGIDQGRAPQPKTFMGGVQIEF